VRKSGSASFQFLGIPPKGELWREFPHDKARVEFPISRDPPEGGTLIRGEGDDGAQ